MRMRLVAVLIFVLTCLLTVDFRRPGQAQSEDALAKIAPWVLQHTAAKQEAEFLVVLTDQADLAGADSLRTKEEKGRYVYASLFSKARATQKPLLDWLAANGIEHRSYYIVNMIWVKGSRDVALTLASRTDVQRIEGNPVIHNALEPAAPETRRLLAPLGVEPGINYTRAPLVWSAGFTGQGIVVGAADTGYRWDHNALKPHYRGWNGVTANHDYNWHDSIHSGGGSCGANSTQPCDDHGHGTHTAGTAVGDDGAGNQIGMAPGAKWIGCRNMDQGDGMPSTYIECFEFFLAPYPVGGTPAQGDPTKAPDVTTNSWGCPPSEGCSAASLQSAVAAQRAAGIVTVVAAGNSGSSCSTVSDPPAIYGESFTVGALSTGTDNLASFSSRGPVTIDGSNRQKPDITAPGTITRSSYLTSVSSYTSLSGTSMATPHVAGGIALLLSAQPSLRGQVSTIENLMRDAAFPLSSILCSSNGVPNNLFGYGRMDVKGAADMGLTTFALQSAAFGSTGNNGVLNISAPAGANWTAVSNDSWIIIVSGSGTGNGAVMYTVTENLNERFRTGSITIARRNFTVRQAGSAMGTCPNLISPASQSISRSGGNGSINVITGEDCVWDASPNANWITISSDNGGIGNGSISFSVSTNATGAARKTTITIAGKSFTVKQK
jgi:serine protease AprX